VPPVAQQFQVAGRSLPAIAIQFHVTDFESAIFQNPHIDREIEPQGLHVVLSIQGVSARAQSPQTDALGIPVAQERAAVFASAADFREAYDLVRPAVYQTPKRDKVDGPMI
jgi:hypothetical protein